MKRLFPAFAAAVMLCGCALKPEESINSGLPGKARTFSDASVELGGDDPIEPFNRSMFFVTDSLMMYVVRPVSWIYGTIIPEEVCYRIQNVSDNLAFPGRMVSCLLQWKCAGAGTELARFLVNSTWGIAGIFDPADYYLHLARRTENMGHAFAAWGIGPGCVFILPICTFTNFRDFIGWAFDTVLDLKFILPYANTIAGSNRAINELENYRTLMAGERDRYSRFKLGLLALRYAEIHDLGQQMLIPIPYRRVQPVYPGIHGRIVSLEPAYYSVDPLSDTLRSQLFQVKNCHSMWLKTSPWNTDFVTQGSVRSVRDASGAPEREYEFFRASKKLKESDKKNTLVLFLPGVGAHYSGKSVRAFAELLTDNGYDVATTSSVMHWEFANTRKCAFPGYAPDDAKNLRLHLKAVIDDLKKKFNYVPGKVVLAGSSLGGLHTLHIAALEEKEPLLKADRYVAVNPPANPLESMRKLYAMLDPAKEWSCGQYYRYMGDLVQKFAPLANRPEPFLIVPQRPQHEGESGNLLLQAALTRPLSMEQASVAISLSFRLDMRQVIMNAFQRGFATSPKNKYSWFNREKLYHEIDSMSVDDYVDRFILPDHKGVSKDQLVYESGVQSLEKSLASNDRIRVLHNLDDPIIEEKDVRFYDRVLGSKITWFDHGGHLGNLYTEPFQKNFLDAVAGK